jgi:uncharacterized damage-inducible protein DinB
MAESKLDSRPGNDEFFEYYLTYIGLVPDGQCSALLESQVGQLREFFANVSEIQSSVVHHPYTWTIKQVVGHLIDAERIFAERLHHFAFNDLQPMNGMDQDQYVANADYSTPTLQALVDELLFCRQANLLLVRRIKPAAWNNRGMASGYAVTARALVWMLVGHIMHHMRIIQRRLVNERH